jgi:hypothetical protein
MPLIGVLLTRYWKPLALAVLIAAAFAYRAILIHERDRARVQLAELTAEAAALRASNQALGAMIDRQNEAVAGLKARADAAENAMTASEDGAARAGNAAAGAAEQQGQALITAPIDANTGCEGAIRWGNTQAGALSSW